MELVKVRNRNYLLIALVIVLFVVVVFLAIHNATSPSPASAASEDVMTGEEAIAFLEDLPICRDAQPVPLTGAACAVAVDTGEVPFAGAGAGSEGGALDPNLPVLPATVEEEPPVAPSAPLAVEMPAIDGVPQPEQLSVYDIVVPAEQIWPVGIPLSVPVVEVEETRTFQVWFEAAASNVLVQKISPDDELLSMKLVSQDGTVRELRVADLGISPMYCNTQTGYLDLGPEGGPALVQALVNRGINPECIEGKNVTEAIAHNIWAGFIGEIKAGDKLVFEIKDQYGLEIGVGLLLSNQGPMDPWTRDLFTGVNMAP